MQMERGICLVCYKKSNETNMRGLLIMVLIFYIIWCFDKLQPCQTQVGLPFVQLPSS